MSNVTDFLAGNTGGYLGIPYPKPSTEYKEVGNVGQSQITATNYQVRGHMLPIKSDPNGHLSVGRGKNITPLNLARASSNNVGGATTQLWTYPLTTSGYLANLWMNPVNDDIYMLLMDHNGSNINIVKVNAITGASTLICSILNMARPALGSTAYFSPVDLLNPNTTQWNVVMLDYTNQLQHALVDPVLGTITPSYIKAGTTRISSPVNYVTADRKIILGAWSGGLGYDKQNIICFFVIRGTSMIYIEMPADGNLPYIHIFITSSADIPVSLLSTIKLSVIGNSVIFSITDDSVSPSPIAGRRLFDRVDFDRWLTAVCDAHIMPTGVGYF